MSTPVLPLKKVDIQDLLKSRSKLRREITLLNATCNTTIDRVEIILSELCKIEDCLQNSDYDSDEEKFNYYMDIGERLIKKIKIEEKQEETVIEIPQQKISGLKTLKLERENGWRFFKNEFLHRYGKLPESAQYSYLREGVTLDDDIRIVERYMSSRSTTKAFSELEEKYESGHRVLLILKRRIERLGKEYLSEKSSEEDWRSLLEIASSGLDIANVNPELNLAINDLILSKIAYNWQTDYFRQFQHHNLQNLTTYIENWYQASTKSAFRKRKTSSIITQHHRRAITAATISDLNCVFCSRQHRAAECPLTVDEKRSKIIEQRLCIRCLKQGHRSNQCHKTYSCANCQRNHLTFMCGIRIHQTPRASIPTPINVVNQTSASTSIDHISSGSNFVATTLDHEITNKYYFTTLLFINGIQARAVFDSLSSETLISKQFCDKIHAQIHNSIPLYVSTINNVSTNISNGITLITVAPINEPTSIHQVHARVVKNLAHLKVSSLPRAVTDDLKNFDIEIVDNNAEIQLIIGNDYANLLITGNGIKIEPNIFAIPTKIGWVASATPCTDTRKSDNFSFVMIEDLKEDDEDDDAYVLNYNNSIQCYDQRYVVRLPFFPSTNITSNYTSTCKQLFRLIKRLRQQRTFEIYNQQIEQLLIRDTIEPVHDDNTQIGFYLPHHCVTKHESTTTKYRIVFNGSDDNNGSSLNNNLFKGVIKWNLNDVLIQFRLRTYGVTADIEKAFHSIELHNDHRKFVKFFWFTDGQLRTYQFKRVPFGLTCSPFLLYTVIHHHLKKYVDQCSNTTNIISHSMYVDDLITSFHHSEDIPKFQMEVKEIFSNAGMNMTKWASSCSKLQGDDWEPITTDKKSVLGMAWDRDTDTLYIKGHVSYNPSLNVTKRLVSSMLSAIFDPLGLVTPVMLPLKRLLRDLWMSKYDWDDTLNEEHSKQFLSSLKYCERLKGLTFERALTTCDKEFDLIVFTDANQDSIGCVTYVIQELNICLLASKQQLLKPTTIPIMELKAIQLASRLVRRMLTIISPRRIICFSDSLINVRRFQNSINKYESKIATKLLEIKQIFHQIFHVPGVENPADLLTKTRNTNWIDLWKRPPIPKYDVTTPESVFVSISSPLSRYDESTRFLMIDAHEKANHGTISETTRTFREQYSCDKPRKLAKTIITKCEICMVTLEQMPSKDFFKLSYEKMLEEANKMEKVSVTSEVRFGRIITNMTLENQILIWAQQDQFGLDEYVSVIKKGRPINKRSLLTNWTLLVEDGIIRIETLLRKAPVETKFPILLLGSHAYTTQLIEYEHQKALHLRQPYMGSYLRNTYFIVGVRRAINHVLSQCLECALKDRATLNTSRAPPMSIEEIPFRTVSIDFAGPLFLRGHKRYLLLLIDLYTRFVCLRVTTSLEAEPCASALRAIFSYYGWPLFKVIKTFMGVDKPVRSVLVKNRDGQTSTRAVGNLVLLPQRPGECVNNTLTDDSAYHR